MFYSPHSWQPFHLLLDRADWQALQASFIASASSGSLLLAVLHGVASFAALTWRRAQERPIPQGCGQ